METFERAHLDSYFGRITERFTPMHDLCSVMVTHLLADRPTFVQAVGRLAEVRAVLPKPKSIHRDAMAEVSRTSVVDELSRNRFADPDEAVEYIEERASGRRLVLLDVGGYFAPTLHAMCDRFSGQVVGVVEDTENGFRRYQVLGKPPCPVFSVARSPLKQPEDYLVGQSVVFSTEALMRSRGDILHGREACVIGFGKLGSSIARMLHSKSVRVTVYDEDPVRMTQAMSQGFRIARSRSDALAGAGVVMCATGNLALRHDDFSHLRNGAHIATVTSSEDELEIGGLASLYRRSPVGEHITRYSTTGHYFYVLNNGNAVNFLHGASVGPFIFLVQAEILAAVANLAAQPSEPGYYEVPDADRCFIAQTWLTYFNRR
ncbi:NAD(P)-binding domain-containing protein [Krasilnikovia sp. MM14-A1004]|uniref:NAD(P)-binding domain-containing protein n=1 Tax=Krasilnikovia sp. MM14-A1004 TaxID=3373541 RepID=UPI00399C4F6A